MPGSKKNIPNKGNKKGNKRWSEASKIEALMILKNNRFDITITAKQLGINRSTLSKWKKDLGKRVFGDLIDDQNDTNRKMIKEIKDNITEAANDLAVLRAAKQMRSTEADLHIAISAAKITAVDRIYELILTSTSLRDVSEAAKTLHALGIGQQEMLDRFQDKDIGFVELIKQQFSSITGKVNYRRYDNGEVEDIEYTPVEGEEFKPMIKKN
jgi:transposase-like protein